MLITSSVFGAIDRSPIITTEPPSYVLAKLQPPTNYLLELPELSMDPLSQVQPQPLLDNYTIAWILFMIMGYTAAVIRSTI